jgi:hypothetical protein
MNSRSRRGARLGVRRIDGAHARSAGDAGEKHEPGIAAANFALPDADLFGLHRTT